MNEYMPCPNCGSTDIKKVGYTWWGGAMGPRIFNHVKCNQCGTTYNGKTGQSNTVRIIIYNIVIIAVLIMVYLFITTLLAGCGQIQVDVPDTSEAQAAQVLVEQYITTNVEYDAEGLLALYADDIFWMDYGGDDGPLDKGDLDIIVPGIMAAQEFKIEFSAYMVTSDGRFAVVEGVYSEISPLTGKWVEAPFVLVLAIKDGLITREEWYYNETPLH